MHEEGRSVAHLFIDGLQFNAAWISFKPSPPKRSNRAIASLLESERDIHREKERKKERKRERETKRVRQRERHTDREMEREIVKERVM